MRNSSVVVLDVSLYEGDEKTVELLYQQQDEQNRKTISEWKKNRTKTQK